jgi:hypothetical protein
LVAAQIDRVPALEPGFGKSIPQLLPHLRGRSSAGVAERVAMSMTGHKTCDVFDRCHIVSPIDLKAAAQKLAGTRTGTLARLRGAGVDGLDVTR